MAALLAGARLVLRQGVRFLPAGAPLRLPGLPARCLSSSARLHTTTAVQEAPTESFPFRLEDETRARAGGWSLHDLGVSLKKFGRVHLERFIKTYEECCKEGKPTNSQAWFMLHICGSALPQMPPAERTALASKIWNKLQELGVEFNASHYNALLNVYLENEHKFSPTEFLASMEAKQVHPDQRTYEALIAKYCNEGDIEGASTILGFMKSQNLPITEAVFNSLITGHARAGDMESAENILTVMEGAGLKPGRNTYLTLVCTVAEKGDLDSIKKVLGSYARLLKDRELLKVISTLVKAGHTQLVPEIFDLMQTCTGYGKELVNLCLELLTQGYRDAALMITKKFLRVRSKETDFYKEPANFLLCQCVHLNLPINDLKKYAAELVEADLHHSPLQFALFYALAQENEDMAMKLLEALKEEGLPLRPHYFWPLLTSRQNANDLKGFFETLKAFHRLGVESDLITFRTFVLKEFKNAKDANEAQATLQEIGFEKDFNQLYLNALKNGMFTGFFNNVYNLLSSNIPLVKNKGFMIGVQIALPRCSDPELMAKITMLLYPDGSGGPSTPSETESVGYFLYGLIEGLSDSETQAKEERLKQYFLQLKEMGVTLSIHKAQEIKQLLDNRGVPQLLQAVTSLASSSPVAKVDEATISNLEEELQRKKTNSEPYTSVLKKLLNAYISTQNLEKIAELKSNYVDDFTLDMYVSLLRFYTSIENQQEALKVKDEIKEFPDLPPTQCYLDLLGMLVANGQIEDAINVLKDMQEKDVPVNYASNRAFYNVLDQLAKKGDVDNVHRLHENIVMLGLAKPTPSMCSPLVTVHLKRNDTLAALEAMTKCFEKYNCAPLEHNLMMSLIESGDTDLLKKGVDHISDLLGERLMLHSLLYAFIELGMYVEAQKISETPGLRASPTRMTWFIQHCKKLNKVGMLEKLLEVSKNIFGCDREEMYEQLLSMYEKNGKSQIDLLRQMKEEGITLQGNSAAYLENDFSAVPTDESPNLKHPQGGVQSEASRLSYKVRRLCQRSNFNEAYNLVLETKDTNLALSKFVYGMLITRLLEAGLEEEAVEVENIAKSHFSDFTTNNISGNLLLAEQVRRDCLKDALVTAEEVIKSGKMPAMRTLTEALALAGDVESLQKLEALSSGLENRIYFSNGRHYFNVTLLAHFRNGNFDEATSLLESRFTEADGSDPPLDYLISALMRNNMPEALEKVSIVAERLANQFAVYRPATDLLVQYVQSGRDEEARQLLQRCNSIMEQRRIIRGKMNWLLGKGEEDSVYRLADLLSDPLYKQIAYSLQLIRYAKANDEGNTMAIYEKMQAEQIQPDEYTLKLLARIRGSGKPIPLTEPTEPVQSTEDNELTNASSPSEDKY